MLKAVFAIVIFASLDTAREPEQFQKMLIRYFLEVSAKQSAFLSVIKFAI
jgi:hypothetical protein